MVRPVARWPQIRALLIGLHVVAVLLLCLPHGKRLTKRQAWKQPDRQASVARWSERLQHLGIERSPEQLEQNLWEAQVAYYTFQQTVLRPVIPYMQHLGVRQGWGMFTQPRRFTGEVHIDFRIAGAWLPLYRPHSAYAWRSQQFTHSRFCKLFFRISRDFPRSNARPFLRWIARQVAVEFPAADAVRLRLNEYPIPAPDARDRRRVGRITHSITQPLLPGGGDRS